MENLNEKKQIEEMARVIDEYTEPLSARDIHKAEFSEQFAEHLYTIGYRKQSEGEWVRKDGFFVCSNCDSTKPFAVLRDEIHYFGCNYCNKCGAKMKGGAE